MAEAATGFLHVVRIGGDIDPVKAEYRIAFAPLDGRLRGRQARCEGLDALTDFLRQAGVPIPAIERTWQALARRRVHSIPRIALTPAQLEALGAWGGQRVELTPARRSCGLGFTLGLPPALSLAVLRLLHLEPGQRGAGAVGDCGSFATRSS